MPRADFFAHRPKTVDTIVETMDRHVQAVAAAFKKQGNVMHVDQKLDVTISAANTDVEVRHQLGAIPAHVTVGVPIPTDLSDFPQVIQSKSPTKTSIFLRASAPCSVTVVAA